MERELNVIYGIPGIFYIDQEESDETQQQQGGHNLIVLSEKENCTDDTLTTVSRTALHEICSHSEEAGGKMEGCYT